MKEITYSQKRVLDAICAYFEEHGKVPTMRELGAALGIKSTNGIEDYLKRLERHGYIARERNGSSHGYVVLRRSDGVRVRARLVPEVQYETVEPAAIAN